jgi:uncharacterized membrane protein
MSDIREGVVETGEAKLPGGFAGQLGPFAVLALTALWIHRMRFTLPERLPIHWNARGQVNGMIARGSLGQPLLTGAILCAMLFLLTLGIRRAAPRGAFQHHMLRVMLGVEWLSALTSASVVVSAVVASPLPAIVVALGGVLVLLGYSIVKLSGFPRVPTRNPAAWHAGLFYADSSDPALFVPRRTGLGYTLNFGNPRAVPVMIGLVLMPIAAIVIAALLH